MTTTDPQRLGEALHDTLRAWPALTGQAAPSVLIPRVVADLAARHHRTQGPT